MTIETLEKYRGVAQNVEAINAEIDALYAPIRSLNGRAALAYSGTPSDPTARAVQHIMELQQDLAVELKRQVDLLDEISAWIAEVSEEEPELVAIIRMHYILGLSWKKTSYKVYGRNDYYLARKRIYRFFGKE